MGNSQAAKPAIVELTAVAAAPQVDDSIGAATIRRPYHTCSRCRQGQLPAETKQDIEDTEFKVRRMQALVGSEFSCRIYTEAHQRGWSRAQIKVVMGDSADWIWNILSGAVSRRHSDRGSLSCPAASLGSRSIPITRPSRSAR